MKIIKADDIKPSMEHLVRLLSDPGSGNDEVRDGALQLVSVLGSSAIELPERLWPARALRRILMVSEGDGSRG